MVLCLLFSHSLNEHAECIDLTLMLPVYAGCVCVCVCVCGGAMIYISFQFTSLYIERNYQRTTSKVPYQHLSLTYFIIF